MYYRQIIAITFGIFCGTVIAFNLNFSSETFLVSLFLFLINLLIFKYKNNSISRDNRLFSLLLSIFFFGVSFGILVAQISISNDILKSEKFYNFTINKNIFIGKITDIKDRTNSEEIFLLVKDETKEEFNIKIITNKIPLHTIGETISVEGKISTSSIILPSLDYSNRSIDTNILNQLQNIDCEMIFPKIKTLPNIKTNVFDEYVYKIKNYKRHFAEKIKKVSSTHGAALGSGTIVGDSSLFDKEEINNFKLSGLSHIIVVSGFNVSIIISIFIFLFSMLKINLKTRTILLILCIFVFIGFIGFEPSVLRAGAMSMVLLLSYLYGRGYNARQSLFLVSLIMILINPKISSYDISFHLSFLATFAILFLYPILKNILKINLYKKEKEENIFKKFLENIYEIFLITLSIQIVTLPYTTFTFGYTSLVGIFTNILVLPIIPIVMFLAILTFIFSFSFLGFLPGLFLSTSSNYIFFIAKTFSNFSLSKIELNISFSFLVIYYFCLILFLYFEEKRKDIKKYLED